MNKTTSIYLDCVRFFAAFVVFLSHACFDRFGGDWLGQWGNFGRDAVMIFFVLSGFVIAYVTEEKERAARDYVLNRFARLYSVVIPALVLTVVLDYAGLQIDESMYDGGWFQDSYPVIRFVASLFLLNEFWFESIRPFSNGPFWSLSYEAAYYALFGVLFFTRGITRSVLFAAVALVVGPKILLLFPVWLIGVAVFRLSSAWRISAGWGWVLLASSVAGYALFVKYDVARLLLVATADFLGHGLVYDNLKWSKFFPASYILGLLVAANFLGFVAVSNQLTVVANYAAPVIRWLAGYTFSLYLFHYPLLQFFGTLFDNWWAIASGTLASVFLLGSVTEKRKHVFRALFAAVADQLGDFMRYVLRRVHSGGSA